MSDSILESRLLRLLQAVIEAYETTAQPVGSQTIVDTGDFQVSSATVRNWFTELDEAGYLIQPHTSGGRVPTEKGYQLYVQSFVQPKPLSKDERQSLEEAARHASMSRHKHLARAVADLTELAVFARVGGIDSYYTGLSQLFAKPEFRDWNRVVSLSEVLDRLDDALHQLPRAGQPRILIGSESPFGPACSVLYLGRDDLTFGILGPLRVNYQRAYSALLAAHDLLT